MDSYKRPKEFIIRVEEDAKDKAIALSQRYGMAMKVVVSSLIDLCVDYDLLKEGWDERLNAAMSLGEIQIQKNRYAELENPCAGLFFADKNWKCLWAREGKPPQIRILAKDLSEAIDACHSCDKTGKILKHNMELKNQITVLESRLEEKSNKTFKAPVCHYGATLSRDGLTFSGCRLSPGKLVSVMEYCKKRSNGRPCSSYMEAIIGVGKSEGKKDSAKALR